MVTNENILLQTLGFDVAIDHPHTHVVRCCQVRLVLEIRANARKEINRQAPCTILMTKPEHLEWANNKYNDYFDGKGIKFELTIELYHRTYISLYNLFSKIRLNILIDWHKYAIQELTLHVVQNVQLFLAYRYFCLKKWILLNSASKSKC